MDRIMYICTSCFDEYPEQCGHNERTELRVMSDGRWLCDGCFDNEHCAGEPMWDDLPVPPEFVPATTGA